MSLSLRPNLLIRALVQVSDGSIIVGREYTTNDCDLSYSQVPLSYTEMSDSSLDTIADGLSRHHDLWFEDGNVVLKAENTIYKLFRGILSKESPLFADMLSLPQGAVVDPSNTYDGCPLISFLERGEDMTCFLAALLDPK